MADPTQQPSPDCTPSADLINAVKAQALNMGALTQNFQFLSTSILNAFASVNPGGPPSTLNVKDFGAKGDGVTDDTAAIQATLQAAYDASTTVSGWRSNTKKIIIPKGVYRIAQSNVLFSGLTAGSFFLQGEGGNMPYSTTALLFDKPSATSADYMINNDDIFGFTLFENISFQTNNIVSNQQFMYYNSAGTAQHLTFLNCTFKDFSLLFDVNGAANTSENTFFNCKIQGFSDAAFRFNNEQSLNWRFYACDTEVFSGVVFDYLQGAAVLYVQGSIIPTDPAGRIVRVPDAADPNTFAGGNFPNLVFSGVRFEMGSGSLMTEKINPFVMFVLIYDNCGMGGFVVNPATTKVLTWSGNGSLVMRNCYALTNYLFSYTVDGTQAQELSVVIDNCDIDSTLITQSTFTVSPVAANIGVLPLFDITNCNTSVDGCYKPADTQFSYNNKSVTKTRRSISFTVDGYIAECTSGTVFNLLVPPVRVTQIEVYPDALGAGFNGVTNTLTVTNAAATTLATASWDMGTPVSPSISTLLNYFVDAIGGDSLNFTFTSTSGGTIQFAGLLYLTY